MKHILEFAKLRDISITKSKKILKKINKEFKNDTRLIFDVFLKNYNKHLILKWHDIESHIMIDRIKERTTFKSTSEFNNFIEKAFNQLFDKHFEEISDEFDKYALHFIENNFYLIVDIEYDNLFKKYTQFFIPTIAISSPINCKTIEINDDNF